MVLCHVSWVPQAFTWNSGWTFWSKMIFRMLLCSWWSSSGFIMIFIWVRQVWMNTWIYGRVICFSYQFLGNNQSMGFSTYIRKLLSQICLGTGVGEIKWSLHLHAHALRNCVVHVLYQLPCVSISDWAGQICFAFAFLLFTYCTVHKASMCRAEHSDHQNVPFVSLRMICKTTIWCNQILIMKQQWRAMILTSRMILPFGIFLVLQCS